MMRQLGLSICALTVLVICTASAYKTGAPAGACEALQPKHKDYKPQTTASPFKITAKRNKDTVDVTISGSTEKFKGFLLVGRTADSEDNQGEWLPVENAKLVKCSKDNDAITHSSNSEKSSITLKWKAPTGFKDSICFKGAVVKNGKIFWTEVRSNSVKF